MPSTSEIGPELQWIAGLSLRTGIAITELMNLDPIYLDAYRAALEAEAAEARRKR